MARASLVLALVGCSAAPPPPTVEHPEAPPVVHDAAVDDRGTPVGSAAEGRRGSIDAAPDAPDPLANAPAYIFRYHTAARSETWTLRYGDGAALLVVEGVQGSQRYRGTATEGASLALDVTTGTAKLALDCKRAKRALGAKCNDKKAKPIDVLDCFHPDFATPMTFGPSPGVEYVVDATCNGFRLVAP
jgi:hypothetical protein